MNIRLARENDLEAYRDLLQRTYTDAYVDESLGVTPELFSEEVFSAHSKDTDSYLRYNIEPSENQRTWFAFDGEELIGAITIEAKGDECELRGFYVDPKRQGSGIGKKLYDKAIEFAGNRDIVLDIYAHNTRVIAIYKRWGFEIDTAKGDGGYFDRHWAEWPLGVKVRSVYMRRRI